MNNTQNIKSKIINKKERTDKNGNQFLILELDDGTTVFVFSSMINENRWDWLEEGKEINFTVEEGKKQNSFVLKDFEIETGTAGTK